MQIESFGEIIPSHGLQSNIQKRIYPEPLCPDLWRLIFTFLSPKALKATACSCFTFFWLTRRVIYWGLSPGGWLKFSDLFHTDEQTFSFLKYHSLKSLHLNFWPNLARAAQSSRFDDVERIFIKRWGPGGSLQMTLPSLGHKLIAFLPDDPTQTLTLDHLQACTELRELSMNIRNLPQLNALESYVEKLTVLKLRGRVSILSKDSFKRLVSQCRRLEKLALFNISLSFADMVSSDTTSCSQFLGMFMRQCPLTSLQIEDPSGVGLCEIAAMETSTASLKELTLISSSGCTHKDSPSLSFETFSQLRRLRLIKTRAMIDFTCLTLLTRCCHSLTVIDLFATVIQENSYLTLIGNSPDLLVFRSGPGKTGNVAILNALADGCKQLRVLNFLERCLESDDGLKKIFASCRQLDRLHLFLLKGSDVSLFQPLYSSLRSLELISFSNELKKALFELIVHSKRLHTLSAFQFLSIEESLPLGVLPTLTSLNLSFGNESAFRKPYEGDLERWRDRESGGFSLRRLSTRFPRIERLNLPVSLRKVALTGRPQACKITYVEEQYWSEWEWEEGLYAYRS